MALWLCEKMFLSFLLILLSTVFERRVASLRTGGLAEWGLAERGKQELDWGNVVSCFGIS